VNARSVRLVFIVALAIASAAASTLNDVTAYTGSKSTPDGWALVVIFFDPAGGVTDVSTCTDVTEIRVPPGGIADSFFASSSGEGRYRDVPLADVETQSHTLIEGRGPSSAVPEPSTFALFAVGAAVLLWRRRR